MSLDLFAFQKEDVDYLEPQKSALIANDMGTGKTYEAIERDLRIRGDKGGDTLVVAPLTTLESTWVQHVYDLTTLWAVVVNPKDRVGSWQEYLDLRKKLGANGVFCVHWEALRLMPELAKWNWTHVIADECHRAKNRKAQQTRALKQIQAEYKTAMSGTPVVNRPDELWSILNWLYPLRYRSYWKFYNNYVDYVTENHRGHVFRKILGPKNVKELQREIKPFYVRRRKQDVLKDLPDKYYCTPLETPILMADGSFKPIGRVEVGEYVFGWEETPGRGGKKYLVPVRVLDTGRLVSDILRVQTSYGTLRCTPDHLWRNGMSGPTWRKLGRDLDNRKNGPKTILGVVPMLRTLSDAEQREALWLGGMFDAEGSLNYYEGQGYNWSIYQSQTHNPEVHQRIKNVLGMLEIPFVQDASRDGNNFRLKTSRDVALKLINWCNVTKRSVLMRRITEGGFNPARVQQVHFDGVDSVAWLQTETGNYVAWGHASKNSEIKVDLTPQQRKAYNTMKDDMIAWIGKQEEELLAAPVVIAQLTRLQQFACTYATMSSDGRVRMSEPSSKLDAVMEVLDETDAQVVVFSRFKQVVNLFADRLLDKGISYVSLTGDTPQADRAALVQRFQRGDARVFTGSLAAGGVGITLHAASRVIFVDRDWSPAINSQAEDRLHRIGQKNAVQVIDIIARNTVDLGRNQMLELKKSWIRRILGDPD